MTSPPCALPPRIRLPLHQRVLPLIAVAIAWPLAKLPPGRLRAVLELLRRGARPGTAAQASAARTAVIAVSLNCAVHSCVQRSVAAAVLCRFKAVWPTWRAGVRTPPFTAHAWIEADGRVIDEPYPDGYYRPLLTVAPVPTGPARRPAEDRPRTPGRTT
ncbi:lasso peptide biosynthesis B2 protein [Streptomyces sp. FH025]|uniref:lasso peptide biosynthesis B2 protein n=1 Tax=Streptomyces sp. FH025 TaxID=2815937 RepID=UPI001A9D2582|nr:lasso peptide biosynthesis B2 protein [Streptomyces sp. FH025]MBO1413305.1 lasso peptide biosynthesis B2 protein [Streptomyces sp. FH025]